MKKRFNLVDAVILLLLVAAAAVSLLFLRSRGTIAAEAIASVPMTFTAELREVEQETIDQMQPGQKLFSAVDGTYLGVLESVNVQPYEKLEYSQLQEQYVSYSEGNSNLVQLVISGDGIETEREITVNGNTVAIGAGLNLKGKGFAGNGFIVAIDTGSAAPAEDSSVGSGETEIVYTVEFSDVRSFTVDAFHVGDRIYDTTTKSNVGTVTDISVEPYYTWELGRDGQRIRVEKPDRYLLVLTLAGNCTETETNYFLDGKVELKLNTGLSISTKYIRSTFGFRSIVSVGGAA